LATVKKTGAGHVKGLGIPGDCVTDANGTGSRNVDSVATVVKFCRSEIETASAMSSPRSALKRTFMNSDKSATGSNWMSIPIVKFAIETVVGRDSRERSEGAKMVKSEFSLGKKIAKEMEGAVGMGRVEDGDEVVFGSLDGTFSEVSAMVARGNELRLDIGGAIHGKKISRVFIIEADKGERKVELREEGKSSGMNSELAGSRAVVGALIVDVAVEFRDDDVVETKTSRRWQFTSAIDVEGRIRRRISVGKYVGGVRLRLR
jgi:hypothetical protein